MSPKWSLFLSLSILVLGGTAVLASDQQLSDLTGYWGQPYRPLTPAQEMEQGVKREINSVLR